MNKYVTNLTLPNGTNVVIKDSECRTNLSNEINRATKKETLLQQNINAEASAREQADQVLQTNIDNEAQARTQVDNTKVNKSDVLTLEEIQASSNLNGKVASADALLASKPIKYIDIESITDSSARGKTNQLTTNIEPIGAILIKDPSKEILEGFALINTDWQNNIYLTILSYQFALQPKKSFKARLYYVDKF